MRLSQVFRNLIGNAIKYRCEAARRFAFPQRSRTRTSTSSAVRDNGIGIDPKYFDNIFVLFKRLHGRDCRVGRRSFRLQGDRGASRRPDLGRIEPGEGSSSVSLCPKTRRASSGCGN